jgi:molybdopterin-binding protein
MNISARNILKGTVKDIVHGEVNTEVTMKPSQNSLFKVDTRVRSVAENGILGLVHRATWRP